MQMAQNTAVPMKLCEPLESRWLQQPRAWPDVDLESNCNKGRGNFCLSLSPRALKKRTVNSKSHLTAELLL